MKASFLMIMILGVLSSAFAGESENVLFEGKDVENKDKACRVVELGSSEDGKIIDVQLQEGKTKIKLRLRLNERTARFEATTIKKGWSLGYVFTSGYQASLDSHNDRLFVYYKPVLSGTFNKARTFDCRK